MRLFSCRLEIFLVLLSRIFTLRSLRVSVDLTRTHVKSDAFTSRNTSLTDGDVCAAVGVVLTRTTR